MGTGIYVHQQFQPRELVKGDTFNDADFGDMVWNGRKWIPEEDYEYKEWMRIGHKYFKYAATESLYGRKPIALLEWLIKFYHLPNKK